MPTVTSTEIEIGCFSKNDLFPEKIVSQFIAIEAAPTHSNKKVFWANVPVTSIENIVAIDE